MACLDSRIMKYVQSDLWARRSYFPTKASKIEFITKSVKKKRFDDKWSLSRSINIFLC